MTIYLTNSLSGKKEKFIPIDKKSVRMYVCGPTVYCRPHIGNTRSSVVFDLLYRVLRNNYPKVTYIRNITDIDDKIIDAANKNNESSKTLTTRMIEYFHDDLNTLHCIKPSEEPKATDNINDIIHTITKLINLGHAYINAGHVYFNIHTYANYGKLSKRELNKQDIGVRIEHSSLKKHPLDFVLWKPKKDHEKTYFLSPWGEGRPGWHIECSVMSKKYLGNSFDIHGGGVDLIFPHHENEIAQSSCESPENSFAKYWVHNGFLTIERKKMSKSVQNFITVQELLGKGFSGTDIRYFYLATHYKKPLDFNQKALQDAQKSIRKFKQSIKTLPYDGKMNQSSVELPEEFLSYIKNDLNTPLAISFIHRLAYESLKGSKKDTIDLLNCCNFLGLNILTKKDTNMIIPLNILSLAKKRQELKENKMWLEADIIRSKLKLMGYQIVDINKKEYKVKPC